MKTLNYIGTIIISVLFVFIEYFLWDYYPILFWIITVPLIIIAFVIIFILLNPQKEYHYEEIESETYLNPEQEWVEDNNRYFKEAREMKSRIDVPNEKNIDYDTRS